MTDPAELELDGIDLSRIATLAGTCTACELFREATQVVFGDGPETASILLLGEQPGDQEDLASDPFVGPAGELLDEALAEAGISRDEVYVTNVVKHFRFEERGKRRLHKKPTRRHVSACRPWLDAELARTEPDVVVALGGSAAESILSDRCGCWPTTAKWCRGRACSSCRRSTPHSFSGRPGTGAGAMSCPTS
jgi:DNA polymerase